jgi:hypothetical protein
MPKLLAKRSIAWALLLLCHLSISNCDPRSSSRPKSERIDSSPSRFEPDSLPNAKLTPGDTLDVNRDDICTAGYTKKIRKVPASVKCDIFESYNRIKVKDVCCEIDHLIPLELGGSNREKNLWPEPYQTQWNAKAKDRLENRLHRLVCDGSLDLLQAQKDIADNWIVAYGKYVATADSNGKHGRQ